MLAAITAFLKKYRQIILYLIFGGITTVVSFVAFFVLHKMFQCYASVSNAVSWVLAVIVAYLTNKPFVFKSHDWSAHTVVAEFAEFTGLRLLSGVLETVVIFLLCDIWSWNAYWVKIGASVFVIVLNYLFSKFIIFRGEEKK